MPGKIEGQDKQDKPNQQSAPTTTHPEICEPPSHQESVPKGLRSWLLVHSQIILSALTLGVLAITLYQTYETREARRLEYRAYIAVKGVALVPRPDDPQTSDLIVRYTNTGRTPGLNGIIKTNLESRETPLSDNPSYESRDVFRSKLVLSSQIDIQTMIASQTVDNTSNLAASFGKQGSPVNSSLPTKQIPPDVPPVKVIVQTKKYYVYGLIEYEDIFGQAHWTKFCYVNTPGTKDWINCAGYNDAN
ncbi:MAG: hypothetical protein ACKVZH_07010 [Blastocatellia bacterium]